MLSRRVLAGVVARCFEISSSLPSVDFPIQDQFPPVAVIGKSFSFTFSPNTFTSSLVIEYSARNLPQWLQLEASKQTFTGVPSRADVGEVQFELEAVDAEGAVTTHVTLIVIKESLVESNTSLFGVRLTESQSFSAPTTLLIHPQTYFNLDLGTDIFQSDQSLIHYATSNNNSPLPAWIHFDDRAVRFSGTTPSLLTSQSSPQVFDFAVLVSHFRDFYQSRLEFHIAVTNHILAFKQPLESFSVSPGQLVSIPPLLNQLQYDSQPVVSHQIVNVSSDKPNWLEIDSGNLSLEGTAPVHLSKSSFSIEVTDSSRNMAIMNIDMYVSSSDGQSIRQWDLGEVAAIRGQYFHYTFARITATNTATAINVDVNVGADDLWLTFSQTNNSLQGVVPINVTANLLKISATIKENDQLIEQEYLTISFINASRTSSDGETSQPTSISIRPEPSGVEPDGSSHISWKRFLPLFITIPILVLLIVCLVITLMFRHAQKRRAVQMVGNIATRDSVESNGSGGVIVVAESCSDLGSDERRGLPPLMSRISLTQPDQWPPTRRPLLMDDTTSIQSPKIRSSWDDMLTEVENLSSCQKTRGEPHQHHVDPDVADHTSAPMRTGSGRGHGTSVRDTISASRQATLRQVPPSPLSASSMVAACMNETVGNNWFHQYDGTAGPSTKAAALTSANLANEIGGMSPANSGSSHPKLEKSHSSRAHRYNRQRTRSTSFSGSLWEDDEWTTQNSISNAAESHRWEQVGMSNNLLQETSLGDGRLRYWSGGHSRSNSGDMDNSTSIRSQGSEQSQPQSLRFI